VFIKRRFLFAAYDNTEQVFKMIRKWYEIGNKLYFHKTSVKINGIFYKSNFVIYSSKPNNGILDVVGKIIIDENNNGIN
jgi:hypothetical protein